MYPISIEFTNNQQLVNPNNTNNSHNTKTKKKLKIFSLSILFNLQISNIPINLEISSITPEDIPLKTIKSTKKLLSKGFLDFMGEITEILKII